MRPRILSKFRALVAGEEIANPSLYEGLSSMWEIADELGISKIIDANAVKTLEGEYLKMDSRVEGIEEWEFVQSLENFINDLADKVSTSTIDQFEYVSIELYGPDAFPLFSEIINENLEKLLKECEADR